MFKLISQDFGARRGCLHLKHGVVETPIFMPVGTVGSVKTLTPKDLEELGAQIILGNTYHLNLRPGMDVIKKFSSLHKFISWNKPILTDSGGYQVFSLGKNVKINEDGVRFLSHLDGSKVFLTPENTVEIQDILGSDIQMVLDECTPYPATELEAQQSMVRSMRWAKRARDAKKDNGLFQFGIVQGGVYPSLRKQSVESLLKIGFDGYSIGGLSVGEPKEDMYSITKSTCSLLPELKPRYLMGVGTPLDLLEGVASGVDMFDCVMPTRNGRNGFLFTSRGTVRIKNSKYKYSDEKLDPNCKCYTCEKFSLGYLRHLFISGELTGLRLFTLHNLTFYLNFMKNIRKSIEEKKFKDFYNHTKKVWI